jgi:hypothetical protein
MKNARAGALIAAMALAANVRAADRPFRVMAFGNSFYENSVPWFQPTMFATAGEAMEITTRIGPGWQVWMHMNAHFYDNPAGGRDELASGKWDAVIIHHFGSHPLLKDNVRDSVWHNQESWGEKRDVSDFGASAFIIDEFLKARPDDGKVFLYVSWPGIPGAGEFTKRVRDETEASLKAQGVDRDEILKKVKERKATLEELTPLLASYDYAAEWLAAYEPDRETPHESQHAHSRDYAWKLMDLLKERFPKLWKEGRLAQIPTGDVFLALDQKMRAGAVPGITNIGFYSRDGGHVRAGLPRYTLAATTFAVMFRQHPKALDAAVYNNIENYRNENMNKLPGRIGSGYIHFPDCGELLEITPERKAIVDDTIWDVVTGHPHTGVTAER